MEAKAKVKQPILPEAASRNVTELLENDTTKNQNLITSIASSLATIPALPIAKPTTSI